MPMPQFEIEFTKNGLPFNRAQVESLLDAAPGFTDAVIVAHGWNNNTEDARKLCGDLFRSLDRVIGTGRGPDISARRLCGVRILWPSKKFEDADLIPGGGAAAADAREATALGVQLQALKHDPERLGSEEVDPSREVALDEAIALIPDLEQAGAQRRFVEILRSLCDRAESHPDDGSDDFFGRDPVELFRDLSEPVEAPPPPAAGGAAALNPAGGAAGFGDFLEGARSAARRLANYTTYYQMKERAGVVGARGLGPLLSQLRGRANDLRIHLVGHSFGGRLVTAAAHSLARETPAVSLTLLQAAYSHNGLAQRFNGRDDGFFRRLLSERRASGPVIISHTKNDTAVGVAYPLVSRIARDNASSFGDQNDPYGGMGRNGAKHTPEVDTSAQVMLMPGGSYNFQPNRVYNLRADDFIKVHSDVTGLQVAYALLCAIATT